MIPFHGTLQLSDRTIFTKYHVGVHIAGTLADQSDRRCPGTANVAIFVVVLAHAFVD